MLTMTTMRMTLKLMMMVTVMMTEVMLISTNVPMQIEAVKIITDVSDPPGLNSAIANVKERKILPSSQS